MPDNALCTPLLRRPVMITETDLAGAWADLWPAVAPPSLDFSAGAFTYNFPDAWGGGMVMPAPIPNDEVAGPARTSWLWPGAEDDLRDYQAHVVVVAYSDKSVLRSYQVMTQFAAAVVKATDALGVYMGGSGLVIRADVFIGLGQKQAVAVPLWVDRRCVRNGDGTAGLFTVGMSRLGLMELEIPSARLSCGDLRMWTMNLGAYLIEQRPNVRDGDTIGMSADERIRVTYAPSMIDRAETVFRLEGL